VKEQMKTSEMRGYP